MSTNAKRLFSAFGGKRTYLHFDSERPGGFIPETVQDLEPILNAAKIRSEEAPGKDLRHVAYIPPIVFDQACREGWVNDKAKWKAWANDPDNKLFRTWPGRL